METKYLYRENLTEASALIKGGNLVSFPTETVYGLGADATNEAAVKKVYLAKGRPSDNPLIVHVDSLKKVEKYAELIPASMNKLMEVFWPGPLTVVLKVKSNVFSKTVTSGLPTAAFRMPNNQLTLDLIEKCEVPLVGPSANTSGKPSPTSAEHVYHDLNGKVSGILDDGPSGIGIESTVIALDEEGRIVILRPGGITKEAIEEVVGPIVYENKNQVKKDDQPIAPGMKYQHYSPKMPVYIIENDVDRLFSIIADFKKHNQTIGLLATDDMIKAAQSKVDLYFSLGADNTISEASRSLFSGLRYFDDHPDTQVDLVLAQGYDESGLGVAYMNRLKKAASKDLR